MPHNPTTDEIFRLSKARQEHRTWFRSTNGTHRGWCSCGYVVSLSAYRFRAADVIFALATHQQRWSPAEVAKRQSIVRRTQAVLDRFFPPTQGNA